MVGINEFGCQYPGIKIEGPWQEGETKYHILPKSQKLILSATENVLCEMSPGSVKKEQNWNELFLFCFCFRKNKIQIENWIVFL